MKRSVAVVLAFACAAACTFDGLDQYTSGTEAGPEGGADASDAPSEATGDACVPTCTSNACGPSSDGCGGECPCNGECVGGVCTACKASWTQSFPGVGNNRHWFDGPSFRMYWSGDRNDDAGVSKSAFIAAIDTCTGAVVTTADPPMVGASPLRAAGSMALAGGKLFVSGATGALAGGWSVLDAKSLGGLVTNNFAGPSGADVQWFMGATAAGNVWTAGWSHDTSTHKPWITRGDGTASAPTDEIALTVAGEGRSIVTSGTNVYALIGTAGQAYVSAYDDTACASACAPLWTTSALAVGGIEVEPTYGVVSGNTLYVAGFALYTSGCTSGTCGFGFVASLDLGTHAWGPMSPTYDSTAGIDGFTGLAVSGTKVYASGATGFSSPNVHGVVVQYDAATLATGTTVVNSTTIAPVWTVDADSAGNLYVSGAPNVAAKCTGTTCP